jgi:hypothetical protein
MRPLKINPGHAITALALSPDGQKLGAVQSVHGFRLFGAITGAELGRDTQRGGIAEVSPTNRQSIHADRSDVRLAEVITGRQFLRFQTGWSHVKGRNRPPDEPGTSALQTVHTLGWIPKPERRVPPRARLLSPRVSTAWEYLNFCALSADHRFVACRRTPVDLWFSLCDLATETVAARLIPTSRMATNERSRLVFTPDGSRAVVATARELFAFDLPPAGPLDAPIDPAAPVLSLAPAGAWEITRPQPDPEIPPFAVLPCGQKVLVRGERSRVELRELATGAVLTVWKWGLPRVNAIAVAGDGLTAAAGGANGRVVMWDLG